MEEPDFILERVTVVFDQQHALKDLSLRIGAGERVGLVGASGAGKTTLLRLLNGRVRPSSGQVIVGDHPLTTLSPSSLRQLRTRLGVIDQGLHLVPNLSALQNVLAGRLGRWSLLKGMRSMLWPSGKLVAEASELFIRLGIGEKVHQRVDTLSGGQQQRVALARALFQQPVALLADEPVSHLDPARAHDLLRLLVDLSVEQGLGLCVSLHDLDMARSYFPRLVGLKDGRIVFDRPSKLVSDQDFATLFALTDVTPTVAVSSDGGL